MTAILSNISLSGMFVESASPQPPGSEFYFELEIAEQTEPLRGRARVEWINLPGEEQVRRPGMGVRFTELAGAGYQALAAAIERRIAAGAKVTEVMSPRDVVDELKAAWPGDPEEVALDFRGAGLQRNQGARSAAAERLARSGRPAPAASTPGRRRAVGAGEASNRASARRPFGVGRVEAAKEPRTPWWRLGLVLGGVAVAISVLLGFWLLRFPGDGVEKRVGDSSASTASEQVAVAGGAGGIPDEGVAATVSAWARAWTDQRVDDYLAFYSQRFLPPAPLSRGEWRRQRVERVSRPAFVHITVRGLEIERLAPDEVAARFTQGYRSDRYEDTVRKTLVLVREEGGWKILSESIEDSPGPEPADETEGRGPSGD